MRLWLAELLRHSVANAERCMPERPAQGRAMYVVGWLLGAAQLTEAEQDDLIDRCN